MPLPSPLTSLVSDCRFTDMSSSLHILYRFFSADDSLLYVGTTCNPAARFRRHGSEKEWWSGVERIMIEHFPSLDSVLVAERKAIEDENPLHNIEFKCRATSAEKKKLFRSVRRAAEKATTASETRQAAIIAALEVGCSVRQVADAAGLSPARIHQIRHGK